MPELLSICIPTFNRSTYLHELLNGLLKEMLLFPSIKSFIKIYISDNASTDNTAQIANEFSSKMPLEYFVNNQNIGANKNFVHLISLAKGNYFWLLGDDEILVEGTLFKIISTLQKKIIDLLILRVKTPYGEADYKMKFDLPRQFSNFLEFTKYCSQVDPYMLIAHSLISYNIINRSQFDLPFMSSIIGTKDEPYAHMYGLAKGLIKGNNPVFMSDYVSLIIRHGEECNGVRARATDTGPRLNFKVLWRRYLKWLSLECDQPKLKRWAIQEYFSAEWEASKLGKIAMYFYYGIRRRILDYLVHKT